MVEKLFSIAYYIFIAALATLGLLLVAALFPIEGNIQIKIVKSGSMEPTIRTGSIVVVKPHTSYAQGDIITFGPDTKKEVPITHRIVGIQGEGAQMRFLTKGDANEDTDIKDIAPREVIGKALFSVPYLGYVIDFARKPLGFFLLIIVPACIVIVDELVTIWKELRGGREKNRDS